jgi:ribosomal protein S18 acetylase RimI-like enzyme
MFHIRPARPGDLDEALGLLVRLQSVPEHHIGLHGTTVDVLTRELADLRWPSNSVVAVDDVGRLRGLLSTTVHDGTALCYGPFVDATPHHPAADVIWARTADALLAAAHDLPNVRGVEDIELCGGVHHGRLATFALHHGFPAGRSCGVLVLDRTGVAALISRPTPGCVEVPTDLDDGRTVITAMDGERVLGHAHGRTYPDRHVVTSVAVTPQARGNGVGTLLLIRLLRALAAGGELPAMAIVPCGDDAARRLFQSCGFTERVELVNYRHTCAQARYQ